MARIKQHLLPWSAQRTWTEASGGQSRALGLCAQSPSLFNTASCPDGAWERGMGGGCCLVEKRWPSIWASTLIGGTRGACWRGWLQLPGRRCMWAPSPSSGLSLSPVWSTCPGHSLPLCPQAHMTSLLSSTFCKLPHSAPFSLLGTHYRWLHLSLSFCLRPPNAAAVTGWLLSRLCSQHLQHGLSRGSCPCNTYRINAWAVKDKSRLGFRPHCPGLLCLGRWCWLCPLALPSHRAPSLLPVNRASPAGSAVGPTLGGICGPAPFSQKLIEEDAETFVVKHTPGSVCSLPPPLLLLASPFLEESARWAGSAGCGQLCSSNRESCDSLPTFPVGCRPCCGFLHDAASKLSRGQCTCPLRFGPAFPEQF